MKIYCLVIATTNNKRVFKTEYNKDSVICEANKNKDMYFAKLPTNFASSINLFIAVLQRSQNLIKRNYVNKKASEIFISHNIISTLLNQICHTF